MEKLVEMERAGVSLYIFGPGWLGTYAKQWSVHAKKLEDGITLEIITQADDLQAAIDDTYEKWVSATRGLPNHGLKQIEHYETPPSSTEEVKQALNLDDEIPF